MLLIEIACGILIAIFAFNAIGMVIGYFSQQQNHSLFKDSIKGIVIVAGITIFSGGIGTIISYGNNHNKINDAYLFLIIWGSLILWALLLGVIEFIKNREKSSRKVADPKK